MFFIISILTAVICCVCVVLIQKNYSYWKRKGVNGPTPLPVFGNFRDVVLLKRTLHQLLKSIYLEYDNEKVVGIYRAFKPGLMIRDPELIKCVLIKDFNVFQNRGIKFNDSRFTENLFVAEDETWKILRQKLTPLFTSGKLRNMTPLISKCVNDYVNYVQKLVDQNIDHEIRLLKSKYTLEVIGSVAFGLNLDTFTDKENEFSIIARQVFAPTKMARVWQTMDMIIPGIRKLFPKLSHTTAHLEKFFVTLVNGIRREREGKPLVRRDFMDLMIELRQQGKIFRRKEEGVSEIELDDELMAAQAFIFYAAGFETSAATMSFLIHELSLRPDIQDQLYKEICEIYKKYNGDITFDALSEMVYLEMVLDETLRKYPIAGLLLRKATADYTFPDTGISIEKGTPIFISVSGLNSDPKYFPNPEEFNPERFSPENKHKIPQCVYLPFGDGPRNCIGLRLAKVQSMMGIAAFLYHFKVEPSSKTKAHLKYDTKGLTLTSQDGIWVKISKRT